MKYMIAVGLLEDAFRFIGPFDTIEEALEVKGLRPWVTQICQIGTVDEFLLEEDEDE